MAVYDPIHDTMVADAASLPPLQPPQPPQHVMPPPEEQAFVDHIVRSNETTSEGTPQRSDDDRAGLKHVLAPTPRSTPSKRSKKSRGGNNRGVTVLSSARSRHLKKEDGQPFWRKDIQYAFLKALFDNNVKAFTDPFPDSPDNVNMDDREHDVHGKLSFAELYIKSIAYSSKCSKVLKDRLLNDMKMSIPTCMICLLVNVGRMNTTINFVPDMKSQLRTYHPIPSLQVNYDSSTTGNDRSNDKQLQDTPRLKSILKACCDDTHEPQDLEQLEILDKLPMTTVVNMIFVLCNNEEDVMKKFFVDTPYYFFDIFINASYDPRSRSELFLWLLYNYLETHMTDEEINKNPFGTKKPILKPAVLDFDIDTQLEREFGERLHRQRVGYLEDEGSIERSGIMGTSTWKLSPTESGPLAIKREDDLQNSLADEDVEMEESHEHAYDPIPVPMSVTDKTPARVKLEPLSAIQSSMTTQKTSTPVPSMASSTTPFAAPQPVLRQDIDVGNVRKVLKGLKQLCGKKRAKQGVIRHEDFLIHREGTVDDDASNRLRLKNYRGDFGEYHTKFYNIFSKIKGHYFQCVLTEQLEERLVQSEYTEEEEEPLKLKSFTL